MSFLRRTQRPPAAAPAPPPAEVPERVERASPGIVELLHGVSEDRSHAVLDLGAAAEPSFAVYSRFARWVRFADLLGEDGAGQAWNAVLRAVPPQPQRPYDLVFAWDVFDRLRPEARPQLVERLAELTAPDARLHLVIEESERAITRPLRFALMDVDRMRYEPAGPPRSARPHLLPAEVERLLRPFEVVRAFTLKVGMREYVAVRRKRKRRRP
jgi:hypothetical protein